MEIFEGTLGDDRTGSWVVTRSFSHLVYDIRHVSMDQDHVGVAAEAKLF